MKYVRIIIFIMILFPISAHAQFYNETLTIMNETGDLFGFAESAVSGEFDGEGLWEYIKDMFLKEFKNISRNFPVLFTLLILFSLKNCIKFDDSIGHIVNFAFYGSVVVLTSGMMQDVITTAKDTCDALGGFIFTTVPALCGVVASGGMPIAATKGAFIILGASNILSFLINNIFFPALYIVYILSVSSAIIENDIFESAKKTVLSCVKVTLPFLVGIFTTVLTMFMKSSSKTDEFVLKSAKMTIGNMVPFLGGVLSDSATVVVSSVDSIKSQLGIMGIFGILAVLIFPIIKMLCTLLTFKILSVLSSFLTNKKMQKYYDELSGIVSVMAGMMGTMAIITLIGILILMG